MRTYPKDATGEYSVAFLELASAVGGVVEFIGVPKFIYATDDSEDGLEKKMERFDVAMLRAQAIMHPSSLSPADWDSLGIGETPQDGPHNET